MKQITFANANKARGLMEHETWCSKKDELEMLEANYATDMGHSGG